MEVVVVEVVVIGNAYYLSTASPSIDIPSVYGWKVAIHGWQNPLMECNISTTPRQRQSDITHLPRFLQLV